MTDTKHNIYEADNFYEGALKFTGNLVEENGQLKAQFLQTAYISKQESLLLLSSDEMETKIRMREAFNTANLINYVFGCLIPGFRLPMRFPAKDDNLKQLMLGRSELATQEIIP